MKKVLYVDSCLKAAESRTKRIADALIAELQKSNLFSVETVVLTEYCDSNAGPKSHEAGLLVMGRLIGKKCIVSDKITSKQDIEKIIAERQY